MDAGAAPSGRGRRECGRPRPAAPHGGGARSPRRPDLPARAHGGVAARDRARHAPVRHTVTPLASNPAIVSAVAGADHRCALCEHEPREGSTSSRARRASSALTLSTGVRSYTRDDRREVPAHGGVPGDLGPGERRRRTRRSSPRSKGSRASSSARTGASTSTSRTPSSPPGPRSATPGSTRSTSSARRSSSAES